MQNASSISSNTGVSTTSITTKDSTLGKDDFLRLLMTQLKNQDPLKPMESYEFSAQLAQFSSLEQLSNIKDILNSSAESNVALSNNIQNSLATNLIGKEVKAYVSSLTFDGVNSVKFGFEKNLNVASASVSLMDSNGKVIKSFDNIDFSLDNNLVWDGKDNQGNIVAAGDYSFNIEAKDSEEQDLLLSAFSTGTISGVRYKSGQTYFVVNGNEMNVKDVMEILGGNSDVGR